MSVSLFPCRNRAKIKLKKKSQHVYNIVLTILLKRLQLLTRHDDSPHFVFWFLSSVPFCPVAFLILEDLEMQKHFEHSSAESVRIREAWFLNEFTEGQEHVLNRAGTVRAEWMKSAPEPLYLPV